MLENQKEITPNKIEIPLNINEKYNILLKIR